MNKIVIGNKEYVIVSNENQYTLEVRQNFLTLEKDGKAYIVIDSEKVCLGTKLGILESVGVILEEITSENKNLFKIWLEKNPEKDWESFLKEVKRTVLTHARGRVIDFVRMDGKGNCVYAIMADGINVGEVTLSKDSINRERIDAGVNIIAKQHPFSLWLRDPDGKLVLEAQGNKEDLLIIVESFKDKYFNYAIETT